MGILTDLVVGDDGDAEKIVNTQVPSQAFGGVDIKGIDTVKFSALHSILTGRPIDELLPVYQPAATASHDEAWVFVIPTELVTRLANLTAAERQSVAERWFQTDAFRLDRWNVQSVTTVMEKICAEATKASSSQRTLFVWVSM
jgi:hypothetical protein